MRANMLTPLWSYAAGSELVSWVIRHTACIAVCFMGQSAATR